MKTEEPEFFSKFLESLGYRKYRCRKCGELFYSLIPREKCPDRPCSKYDFLKKEYPTVKPLSLDEARNKFINFFRRNGHGYMDPYPVLARWRNDLYLTIASIIVFQPAVTEGIVDPPYNPLVIVQPCIRLEDIDEVGLTFGRHLSSFEMGGHHAFNKKNNYIYWYEETLEYAYKFFTEEIGIPPEDLVFKQSWWEGGGNAGPAYEVLVDGLELATLVFMKYRVVDGNYEPMDVSVIDTGYGIERIAWFTRRDPTSFHTIYGGLVDKFKDILGVEEPEYNILKNIVHVLSDKEGLSLQSIQHYLKGIGYSEYTDLVEKSINLYTLLDHTRTIALMLSDGIVPSNTGEGYLARLVIRRSLRTLYRLGFNPDSYRDIMLKLMDETIKYWKGRYIYDKFSENVDYIMDVIAYETNKYVDTLNRGLRIVEKMIKRKKSIELDDLVKIYDSHGIPPELVADKARERGIEINIPHNFYAEVARRHGKPAALEKYKELQLPQDIVEWVSSLQPTVMLFHRDPYLKEFRAKVVGVKDRYIVLDKTAFYPIAGGQDHDTGYIVNSRGESRRVVKVYKYMDKIVHELEEPVETSIRPGEIVHCTIDWKRRYRLMRHHTATHIILGAVRKILGEHVWQAGAEKTVEKGRLDITHYKMLTKEEIDKIEKTANKIIDKRIDIVFNYLDKFDAEKKYGTKIYQGGAIVAKKLRIVEIPGWDAEACFGTHLTNTGEVGGIKIVNVEKIQDGVVRLEYIAGTRIPEYSRELETIINAIASKVGSSQKQVVKAIEKLIFNLDNFKAILSKYRKLYMDVILNNIDKYSEEICEYKIVYLDSVVNDEKLYRDLIIKLTNLGYIIFYNAGNYIEIALNKGKIPKPVDLRYILEYLKEQYKEIKGGGKEDHITVKTDKTPHNIYNLFKKALMEISGCVEK